ncbi:hypothetical protein GCM10027591_11730 [Zhihengliuella somnathii]
MSRRRPIPPQIDQRVFTTRQALALGVSIDRLRASDMRRLTTGLHINGSGDPSELAQLAALRYRYPQAWLSHASAARAYGLWAPHRILNDERLHISLPAGARAVRTRGIAGHVLRAHPEEIRSGAAGAKAPVGAVAAVSTPARTWLDLAPQLSVEELVIIGDQLVRRPYERFDGRSVPWADLDSLAALLERNPKAPGVATAREALRLVRVGSDSRQETRLRLAIVRAGLPEPELQIRVHPNDWQSIPADMGYRAHRLALHYEGQQHRSAEQFVRDIRRDRQFESAEWKNLRFTREDARQGFSRAVFELRRRLDLGPPGGS